MSQLDPVVIDTLPASIKEFRALRDRLATTPQGGAAMMILALFLHTNDHALGRQCLTVAVDRDRLQEGDSGYQDLQLARRALSRIDEQLGSQPYLSRAYIQGATPDNGYQLPDLPYLIEFAHNPRSGDPESGQVKVFVLCSGAASPRPVTVRRNPRGLWKAYEWSSLVMGIMPATRTVEDDL